MTDETQWAPHSDGSETPPVDLGLIEGRSMGYLPTSALAPDGPPIGGLLPAGPGVQQQVGGDSGTEPTVSTGGGSGPARSAPTQDGGGQED
jgi:hypothetical protein